MCGCVGASWFSFSFSLFALLTLVVVDRLVKPSFVYFLFFHRFAVSSLVSGMIFSFLSTLLCCRHCSPRSLDV
eukprot:m.197649 g.197649  ORF g.197649 m.197649 type:complete len:73 (-) comp15477_c16_seq5:16-234(-)